MEETIGISIRVPKFVRNNIAMAAKREGRSMSKQMLFILTKEAEKIAKKGAK